MAMRTPGTVSVVVPSYGHERFILPCLESIHDQTYGPVELVLVDDRSPDATFERARTLLSTAFAKRFVNVVLLRNDVNAGAHAAINRGVAAASGDFVTVINSDDLYAPERLTVMMEALRGSGSSLAFSLVDVLDSRDPEDAVDGVGDFGLLALRQFLDLRRDRTVGFGLLRANLTMSTGNLLFTRDLFRRIGSFLPLRYCHDWDFVLQSLYFTEPVAVAEPLYLYRLHGANSFLSLGGVAGVETEVVMRRFFRRGLSGRSPNPLCPSEANWPGYFGLFVEELGLGEFLDRERGEGGRRWRIYDRRDPTPGAPAALDRAAPDRWAETWT
jgi:glycosyltransferase involved in cell wall biosynthesis